MKNKYIYLIVMTILVLAFIPLHYMNEKKSKEITDLQAKKESFEVTEEKVMIYDTELKNIKELKQTILGQENQIDELTNQNKELKELISKNKDKLAKLEEK